MRVLSNADVAPVGIRSGPGGEFVRKIEIGQRFKQTNPPGTVWEVLEAVLDPADIRHLVAGPGGVAMSGRFVSRDKHLWGDIAA
jgi:hypothetical protein